MKGWETVSVGGSEMRCYKNVPDGGRGVPGVAVLHGGYGFDELTERTVDWLAAEGIAAIAPDLFHRGIPERPAGGGPRSASMRAADFVTDVNAALERLGQDPSVAADRLGVMGFCMGGQTTYLVAGHNPELRAGVAFYPGFVFNRLGSGEDPAPFDLTDNIKAPLLVLSGADDTNPSPADVARIDESLTKLGVIHEVHVYPGAAHAFMSEGSPSYREDAAKDAWRRCLGWLKQHL